MDPQGNETAEPQQQAGSSIKGTPRRRFLKIAGGTTAGVAIAGTGLAALMKPSDAGGMYSSYFASLNSHLKELGIGRPCIVLDLDRVDHNIARVKAHLTDRLRYRLVSKSNPSLELLAYVLKKANTTRVMAFHQPFLNMLIQHTDATDILMGKPLLAEAVNSFYLELASDRHSQATETIQWLVDTDERLHRHLEVARRYDQKLRVNLEIDVGLHRGGAADNQQLDAMLKTIAANPRYLKFTGLMGYEAHVTHAPPIISSTQGAFQNAIDSYVSFHSYGQSRFPALFEGDLTFNSGGSTTYQMFPKDLPINDIAAGSAITKPSTFGMLKDHEPALFIAAPVIKKLDGPQVPFVDFASDCVKWWDPNMNQAIYLYGGGWAAEIVAPPGVAPNPLTAGPPNQNLLPNQSLCNMSASVPLEVGDFVFFHPQQGDAMIQFDEILVMRENRITQTWKPFPIRL